MLSEFLLTGFHCILNFDTLKIAFKSKSEAISKEHWDQRTNATKHKILIFEGN